MTSRLRVCLAPVAVLFAALPVMEAAPPAVVNQPSFTNMAIVGDSTLINFFASGTAPLTYQWQRDGVDLPGETRQVLSISRVVLGDAGTYRVIVSNAEGTVTSAGATLQVFTPETGPRITLPVKDAVVSEGGTARFESAYAGPGEVQWQWSYATKSNPAIFSSSVSPVLELPNVTTEEYGKTTVRARARVTLPGGEYVLYQEALVQVVPPGGLVGRLRGSAHRGEVGNGSDTMISGIIIQGSTPGRVLIRGSGPAMASLFPAGTTIVDPEIELFDITGARVATNDNWNSGGGADIDAATLALGLTPFAAGAKDAALLVDLPAGNYTVHLRDRSGGRGIGLVELYDVNPGDPSRRIVASATRAKVSPGNGALIQGFFVDGSTPRRFMIRGLGPKLVEFGVANAHPDPRLELYPPPLTTAGSNDSWNGGATDELLESIPWREWMFRRIGLPPLTRNSKDATLVITLPPGAYTVQLRAGAFSPADTTGVALLEMYEMP